MASANCVLLDSECAQAEEKLRRNAYVSMWYTFQRIEDATGKVKVPTAVPTVSGTMRLPADPRLRPDSDTSEDENVLVSYGVVLGISVSIAVTASAAFVVIAYKNRNRVASARLSTFVYTVKSDFSKWIPTRVRNRIKSWTTNPLAKTLSRKDAKAHLVAFYRKHNPENLVNVEAILDGYAGRFGTMFGKIQKKYGIDPLMPTQRHYSTIQIEMNVDSGEEIFNNSQDTAQPTLPLPSNDSDDMEVIRLE